MSITLHTNSPEETINLGKRIGTLLKGGEVLALIGDLAAGKTTFTKGIAEGLGLDDDIHSPTFTLVHEHIGDQTLYHIDLYRLEGQAEMDSIGLDDYIYSRGVAVIEWADRLDEELPEDTLYITITANGETGRCILVETASKRLHDAIEEIASNA